VCDGAVAGPISERLSEESPTLPRVWADRIQLQQVLLNLVMNAIEAMSGAGDGPRTLVIRSGLASEGGFRQDDVGVTSA
jgi:C4-dicarboxylate-specific signal transduction histidine kinase